MTEIADNISALLGCYKGHPQVSNRRLADLFTIGREQLGKVLKRYQVSGHTTTLLKYHEEHPELSNRRLAELFALTKQRVGQIINRLERDRMVVQYCQTHPDATSTEVAQMFHITEYRVRSLLPSVWSYQVSETEESCCHQITGCSG